MRRECNVIIFGSVDWNEAWQMHHQLATSHATRGDRVLYINNLGVRSPSIRRDWKRIIRKIGETVRSQDGFKIESSDITILSPAVLPSPYGKIPVAVNSHVLNQKIGTWLRCGEKEGLIIYTFLPTPAVIKTCLRLEPNALVYFCANNMAGTHPEKQKLLPYEEELIHKADGVITISSRLRSYILSKRPDCMITMIPPGLDERFARIAVEARDLDEGVPEDLRRYREPYIGYVGSISTAEDVFDKGLIKECAQQNRNATFVLIGESYGNNDDLGSEPNIVMLGKKDHIEIPRYLRVFKAGLLPYKVTSYTDYVNPCKVNEYLAFGLPVISTAINEMIIRFGYNSQLVEVCNERKDFINSIRAKTSESMGLDTMELRMKRMVEAQSTRWSEEFKKVESLLYKLMFNKRQKKRNDASTVFSSQLNKKSKKRRILIASLAAVATSYWVLMQSPLLEEWSKKIAIDKKLGQESTLVLIAGEGEGQYWNRGIIGRAADLKNLRVQGSNLRRVVIAAPRYTKSADLAILESFAQSYLPEEIEIDVLREYGGSSYENAKTINSFLLEKGAREVAIVSSRHHTRRLQNLLRTLARSRYKINGISNQDIRATNDNDRIKLLKVLLYESGALTFDWLTGMAN